MFENIWYVRCRGCGAKGRIEADGEKLAIDLAQLAHRNDTLDYANHKLCSAGFKGDIILMHPRFLWLVVVGDTGKLPGHKRDYEGLFKGAFAGNPENDEDLEGLKWAKEFAEELMVFIGRQEYPESPAELWENGRLTRLDWESKDGAGYIAIRRQLLNPLYFAH